ncbi:MAG: PEP-CTERM sorting domain-containing protein [Kiritimatiellae bacterium]|nr:PEP-CTERM sorting domain-containing protein [Kiritimatiellia bacterium]
MKKLIIAVAMIAVAGLAQAATCRWQSGTLKTAANAEGGWSAVNVNTASALVTMSIYYIDADTYTSLASASQKDLFDSYSTQTADLTGQNKNANTGALIGAITINDSDAYAGVQYAVVTATYTDSTYGDMYMATRIQTAFSAGIQAGTAANMLSSVGNWQAVPEPTSGLLMLLGMAGLALRRKRA